MVRKCVTVVTAKQSHRPNHENTNLKLFREMVTPAKIILLRSSALARTVKLTECVSERGAQLLLNWGCRFS